MTGVLTKLLVMFDIVIVSLAFLGLEPSRIPMET
jgi:hypothetical protein